MLSATARAVGPSIPEELKVAVTVVKASKLNVKLRDPAFAKLFQHSSSPGPAAVELGISRQGLHLAIQRGRLDAIRLESDRGDLMALVIPDEAVQRYKTQSQRKAG